MATVQLPGSHRFYAEIEMHTSTHTSNMNSAQEFQKRLSNALHKTRYFG